MTTKQTKDVAAKVREFNSVLGVEEDKNGEQVWITANTIGRYGIEKILYIAGHNRVTVSANDNRLLFLIH
jgi:hypothetical protein